MSSFASSFGNLVEKGLERGKVLADKAKELGTELGRGLASGHKPQLVEVEGRQLVLLSLIAEGGYAYVHLARDTTSGDRFAVKRALAQDKDNMKIAEAELELLRTLPKHPNVIQLFGACRRQAEGGRGYEYLYVLELCKKGSLAKHVTPRSTGGMPPKLREARLLQYFVDTCKGVAHMHSQTPPIQHRDLKLENVLCTEKSVCKLCDFGSATTRVLDCATACKATAGPESTCAQPLARPLHCAHRLRCSGRLRLRACCSHPWQSDACQPHPWQRGARSSTRRTSSHATPPRGTAHPRWSTSTAASASTRRCDDGGGDCGGRGRGDGWERGASGPGTGAVVRASSTHTRRPGRRLGADITDWCN